MMKFVGLVFVFIVFRTSEAKMSGPNATFLRTFTELEHCLKRRLGFKATDKTMISTLIDKYQERSSLHTEDCDIMRRLCGIRNLLTHEHSASFGEPFHISETARDWLGKVLRKVTEPEEVGARFKRKLISVEPEDSLSHILQLAFEKQFSQFPVFEGDRFRGLITENGITRWLGRHITTHGNWLRNFDEVFVKQVLPEETSERDRGDIYKFRSVKAPVTEVMALFAKHPILEAVLLKDGGNNRSAFQGIVTQWDAARFIEA